MATITATPTLLAVGTAVRITDDDGSKLTGRIAGHGTVTSQPGSVNPVYLVTLDAGFYNADRTCFVDVLSVHPDNVSTDVPFCAAHSAHNCPFDQED